LFSHYHTTPANDISRLLDGLAGHNFNHNQRSPTPTNRQVFTPNFDVHETNAAFVLEGELLRLENKSHVNIEFIDDNALLIKGRIKRKVHSTTASDVEVGENKENQKREDKGKQLVKKDESVKERENLGVRYWVAERSVGELQRSFSFPRQVEVESVKASLEDGVLGIVVPKREVVRGRKIEIS
ncbi:putative heat shock protein Hsp30/Hsp42, partial [Morchella snyderi]